MLMSSNSLFKVPLLLTLVKCLQVALTSPTPVSKHTSEERARYVREHKTDELIPLPNFWGPKLYKAVGYIIILTEICAILLSQARLSQFTSITGALPVNRLTSPVQISRSVSHTYISPLFLLGTALFIFGAAIRSSCYRHLGRHFTFELTLQENHQLVTSGPYCVVRHPSYLGMFLYYIGSILCLFGPGSFYEAADLWNYPLAMFTGGIYIGLSIYVAIALFARVAREDEVLKSEFKDQWVSWSEKTPYRLVPYVY